MIEPLRTALSEASAAVDGSLPQSAVLVLIDNLGSEPRVLLTRRAQHLRLHAGEVAFPGGQCDPGDPHPWATALREAEEEVAVSPDLVEFLGFMTPLVTRTGIQVTPCVGRLRSATPYVPNRDELDCIFEAPLAFFAQADNLQLDEFIYGERVRGVPRYEYEDFTIWGITAAILARLVNLALNAGLDLEDYWKGRTWTETKDDVQP